MKRPVYSASRCEGRTTEFGSVREGSIPSEATKIFKAMPVKLKKEKVNKYHNRKVVIDGIEFDSTKEGKRYLVLKEAQAAGLISELTLQPKFELIPAIKETYVKHLKTKDKECERTVQLPITYSADFAYCKDGQKIIEDVKASPYTTALDKAFLIKEKLFRYFFGFPIKRVYKPDAEV